MKQKTEWTSEDYDKYSQLLLHKSKEICSYLGLNYLISKRRIILPCPIHGSSGDDKLNIFLDGKKSVGNWVCWSGDCQHKWGADIVGFARGVLSQKKGREIGRGEAIRELSCLVDEKEIVRGFDSDLYSYFYEDDGPEEKILSIPRETAIKSLTIPSKYYISRGYSPEILKKYDVGECWTKGKQMYLRAVCPVYNLQKQMVGCVGRSIHPSCTKCKYCHPENYKCPESNLEKLMFSKWRNSKGFYKANFLYNLWYSKPFIEESGQIILVEGQGDVWRLEEAGIHNSVGIFGRSLTDSQLSVLEKLPIKDAIILTDNDEKGIDARKTITQMLERMFRIRHLDIPDGKKDVGEMSINQINDMIRKN